MSCETSDEVDSWKASFFRAGVYPEKQTEQVNGEEVSCVLNVIIVTQSTQTHLFYTEKLFILFFNVIGASSGKYLKDVLKWSDDFSFCLTLF